MEDFSNDLFSSFFDDPVLDEKSPLLDMELDSPTPGIQAEHSYSLSGDSAPQSPLVPIKMEDTTQGKKGGRAQDSTCNQGQEERKLLQDHSEAVGGEVLETPTIKYPQGGCKAFLFSLKSSPGGHFSKEFVADLGRWWAKDGPQTAGSITWEPVRNVNVRSHPDLRDQKPCGEGSAFGVILSHTWAPEAWPQRKQ